MYHQQTHNIVITGHAEFNDYGKDIVCASASSIVITSINACLNIDAKSIVYKNELDKLTIDIKSDNNVILKILDNMLNMLSELANDYPKNVKIIKDILFGKKVIK